MPGSWDKALLVVMVTGNITVETVREVTMLLRTGLLGGRDKVTLSTFTTSTWGSNWWVIIRRLTSNWQAINNTPSPIEEGSAHPDDRVGGGGDLFLQLSYSHVFSSNQPPCNCSNVLVLTAPPSYILSCAISIIVQSGAGGFFILVDTSTITQHLI